MTRAARRSIIIVGGGASGTILAAHLLRDPDADIRVTVIEKRVDIGRGVAYSTPLADHVLNVSAYGMSAFADDPEHFFRWLAARGLASPDNPRLYVPRAVYGDYLEQLFGDLLEREKDSGRLQAVNENCLAVFPKGAAVEAWLENGTSLVGHVAILATGHAEPASAVRGHVRPGSPDDTPLDPDSDVLVLGTGLSMIDTWLSLDHAGHRGRIVALSRRGLLPSVHRAGSPIRLDAADIPLGTDLSYFVRWFRGLVKTTRRAGGDWRDVVDGLRPFNQAIWQNWSCAARRRFIEHTRAWWDVHRHRMPPDLFERMGNAVRTGRIAPLAGRLVRSEPSTKGLRATIKPRAGGEPVTLDVARIYDCTGISADLSNSRNPAIRALIGNGFGRPDRLRIGLDVTTDCAVIDRDGAVSGRLFAVGPLTRGTFFEIEAIPDIRRQCAQLAATLLEVGQPETQARRVPV